MTKEFRRYAEFVVNDSMVPQSIISHCKKACTIELTCKTFEKAGLMNEFNEFYKNNTYRNVMDGIEFEDLAKEFAKMHPDVFYVPEEVAIMSGECGKCGEHTLDCKCAYNDIDFERHCADCSKTTEECQCPCDEKHPVLSVPQEVYRKILERLDN